MQAGFNYTCLALTASVQAALAFHLLQVRALDFYLRLEKGCPLLARLPALALRLPRVDARLPEIETDLPLRLPP